MTDKRFENQIIGKDMHYLTHLVFDGGTLGKLQERLSEVAGALAAYGCGDKIVRVDYRCIKVIGKRPATEAELEAEFNKKTLTNAELRSKLEQQQLEISRRLADLAAADLGAAIKDFVGPK